MTSAAGPRVLLVGESNPYGSDPFFALYHLPRGASGDRIREILGLTDVAYSRLLSRANLCSGKWSLFLARQEARRLLAESPQEVFVLLGARVRDAFGIRVKFYERHEWCPPGPAAAASHRPAGRVLLVLPHPSGRNLLWNEPGARERARELCRAAAPEVPWGSVGTTSSGSSVGGSSPGERP